MAIYDKIDVSHCDLQAVIKTSNQIEIQNIRLSSAIPNVTLQPGILMK